MSEGRMLSRCHPATHASAASAASSSCRSTQAQAEQRVGGDGTSHGRGRAAALSTRERQALGDAKGETDPGLAGQPERRLGGECRRVGARLERQIGMPGVEHDDTGFVDAALPRPRLPARPEPSP